MGIENKHPDFEDNEEIWEFCEKFYEGAKSVKDEGTKYLPKLSGQNQAKYNAYKDRAIIPGFVPRTVSALVGAIFRREPHFKLPEKLQYLLTDADGEGSSLVQLAVKIVTEVMVTGRAILVVDRDEAGNKPYITFYDSDDLTNWNSDFPFFVLEDSELVSDPKDKFKLVEEEGYRELTLDADGNYIVNIWRKVDKKKDAEIVDVIQPLKNGRPIQYIPIVCVSPSDIGFEVSKSPILELCEVTRSAYTVSADYFNALHVTGSPTPVISDDSVLQDDKFVLNLGVDAALKLGNGGTAKFLEADTNFAALENAMKMLENLAAILGARLLDTSSSSQMDTATSAMIKESASTAILSSVISSVEAALTKCLVWIADWESVNGAEIEVALNKELVQARVDANMLNALVAAYQSGSMSLSTFYHNLQEGGLTEPGIDVKDEATRIIESTALKNALNPPTPTQNVAQTPM